MKRPLSVVFLTLASVAFAEPKAVVPPKPADRLASVATLSPNKAKKEIKKWMKAEPKSPWPWVAQADLQLREKRYNKCLSSTQTALERGPQTADAYYLRGRCFEGKGKTLDAANEYRAALEAETDHAEAKEALARLQVQLGAADAAARPN